MKDLKKIFAVLFCMSSKHLRQKLQFAKRHF